MEDYRVIISADGTQHAITTDDGIRYDLFIIDGTTIPFKFVEKATAAAIAADDMEQAAKDSLVSDGIDITAIDVIVTATGVSSTASTTFYPHSLSRAAIEIIAEHADAIADILREYQRNKATTAIAAHADAIKNITRTFHHLVKSI